MNGILLGDHMKVEGKEKEKKKTKLYICPKCKKLFFDHGFKSQMYNPVKVKNKESLKSHYMDRPWELLAKVEVGPEETNILRCIYCKKTFLGIETFAAHLEDSNECYNYIMQKLMFTLRGKKKEFEVWDYRPGEKNVVTQSIMSDPMKKRILYPWGGEVDYAKGTTFIAREMQWGPKHEAATIFGVAGIPGSGKSTFVNTLSFHHRGYWRPYVAQRRACEKVCKGLKEYGGYCMDCPHFKQDAKDPERTCDGIKVAVMFSIPDALDVLQYLTYGDLLIVDEMPLLVGEGSATRMKQLKSILNILRKECISWFFVNPQPQRYIKNYNLVLETVAKNDARDRAFDETVGVCYNRKLSPIGWFRVKVISNSDNPIYIEFLRRYELAKDDNINKLKKHKGAQTGVLSLDTLNEYIPELYNFMVEYGLSFPNPGSMTEKDVGFCVRRLYKGSTKDLADLSAHFLKICTETPDAFPLLWKTPQQRSGEVKQEPIISGDIEFMQIDRIIGDKEMFQMVWQHLGEAEKIAPTKSKTYMRGHADAYWMSVIEGIPYDNIGMELGRKYKGRPVSGAAIANKYSKGGWIAKFREEILGTLFELYHLGLVNGETDEYIRKGGIGETDIVHKTDDIGVEVKCRHRQIEVPEDQWGDKYLTTESRERVMRGGRQLLVLYTIERGTLIMTQYAVQPKLPDLEVLEDDVEEADGTS